MPSTILALFIACNGGAPIYQGHNTYEYFPLEGERSWRYALDVDSTAEYLLEVEKVSSRVVQGTEIALLEYRRSDTADLLFSVEWSSDAGGGILVHSFEVQGGASETFDTPVQFAEFQMRSGESVTTQTNGYTFTATMVGVENCPNLWVSDVWECLHFQLDDGGAGVPFAGDWWGAGSWGPSRMRIDGWTDTWVLTNAYYCDPGAQDCD